MAIEIPIVAPSQATHHLSGVGSGKTTAMLYLFPPNQIPDQIRRPHVYQFKASFISEVQQGLTTAISTGQKGHLASMLPHSKEVPLAIQPEANGIPIDTGRHSTLWSFVLIVDKPYDNQIAYTQNQMKIRTLFSGFCQDEPFSRGLFGQEPQPNSECFMVVTHHTSTTIRTEFDSYGGRELIIPTSTVDYVDAGLTLMTAPQGMPLFGLRPEDIQAGTHVDDMQQLEMVSGTQSQLHYHDPIRNIGSELANPRHHMQLIAKAMHTSIISVDPFMDHAGSMDSLYSTADAKTAVMQQDLVHRPPPLLHMDLDPNRPFTLGMLDQMFGTALHVVNVGYVETARRWEVCPQHAPTARNIMSSMLADMLPGEISNVGLCEVAFRYNSWMTDGTAMGMKGIDMPSVISGIVPMPDNILQMRYNRLIEKLKVYAFPTIMAINGEFDLTVHCSLAGASVLNLTYLDDLQSQQQGFTEVPNTLGGLRSPLIGGYDVFSSNARNMASLVSGVMDVPGTDALLPQTFNGVYL